MNQLAMDKSFAINNLRRSGYSERRIAETLGVSRGAVRRHLRPLHSNGTKAPTGSGGQTPTPHEASNSTKAPTGSEANPDVQNTTIPHVANCSHCEPFRDLIVAKFNLGLTAKRIHQDLVAEHGFDGKYWSVNRFVRALESTQEPPFRRMEVQPGEELQVDFGTGAKIRSEQGTYRRTHVLRCVLSHSRKGYSEAVYRQDTESFIRVLENAFWALGGVPRRVVFDNAKCAVKTPDYYDPELNPKLTEFCKHYQVAFIPTRVRTPRHKGKVERGVDYIQENALRGREFRSLAEQNAFLEHWERTVADTRIHGTTFKHVRKDFETNERGALTKLPLERFAFYHEAKRKVSRDGHISVNKAFYSVPPEYLGREVWVRYDSRLVRILDASLNHVMTHSVIEQGRFRTDPRHIVSEKISPIERGIANIYGKIRHIGPNSARWAEGVIATRGVEASRVVQGVLTMSHKYRSVEIERACDIAWRSGAFNCRIIRTILKRQDSAEQSTMDFMETHPIIRSIDEYGQFIHERVQERILQ